MRKRRSLPKECLRGIAAPIGAGPPAGRMGSLAQEAAAASGAPAGDGSPHRRGPTSWGERESCPGGGRCLRSACGGRQPPSARAHRLGGLAVLPKRRSLPKECLRGIAAPIGAGPPAGRMGSLAQEAAAASGAPAGDGSPHRRGPTSWGERESCPGGGRCLRSACGRRQPPSARAHQLGGLGVLPKRRSLPKECLRGIAAPIGAGPPAGRMGSLAQEAAAASGAPAGDGSPHRRGPTSWGERESCRGGGRCLRSACGGRQPPKARAHRLGGRGVLPRRRWPPTERLRGTAAPKGAGSQAGGTGSPAQAVVGGPYTLPQRIFDTFTRVSYRTGAHRGWAELKSS